MLSSSRWPIFHPRSLITGYMPSILKSLISYCFTRIDYNSPLYCGNFCTILMNYLFTEGGIVNNTLRPPIPKRCDSEWKKLMEECWSPDPADRPSFTDITHRLRDMSTALQKKRPNVASR